MMSSCQSAVCSRVKFMAWFSGAGAGGKVNIGCFVAT